MLAIICVKVQVKETIMFRELSVAEMDVVVGAGSVGLELELAITGLISVLNALTELLNGLLGSLLGAVGGLL